MKQTHPEVLALCGGFQPSLRSVQQPKKPAQENPIHTADGVILPEFVKRTLRQGPKYAIEPRLTAPKLLSLVRKVAGLAPDSEKERCISEGVDVLHRFKPKRRQLPIRKVVTYLIESGLCIIPSDKEGTIHALSAHPLSAWRDTCRPQTEEEKPERRQSSHTGYRFFLLRLRAAGVPPRAERVCG
ncbi:hypothetical protein HPB52_002775 [Rhipicephalus sanguineus]|uniref:Uncharacterized protein n=1 Tax=Rhipicephalus sanguineus TaxID=34632 RepID=A0A9D4T8I6_RHISA|nr:hypothetical protein HPB52_002775 [Rhipicephalus sanguineus]